MIHRYCLSLLLFLLVFTLPILSSHTACPYDLNTAFDLIPAICYANATAATDTCCWLIFITYIYATIRHANLTSEAFLPIPEAFTCAFAFSASLIRHGLIRPSLLNSSDSYKPFRDFGTGPLAPTAPSPPSAPPSTSPTPPSHVPPSNMTSPPIGLPASTARMPSPLLA